MANHHVTSDRGFPMSEARPQVQVEKQPRQGMGKLIALAVVVVLVLVLIFQNTTKVQYKFLFFDFTWPAWAMLLVTLIIGFLLGMITVAVLRRRRRKARRDERALRATWTCPTSRASARRSRRS